VEEIFKQIDLGMGGNNSATKLRDRSCAMKARNKTSLFSQSNVLSTANKRPECRPKSYRAPADNL
jgi:hypothetical protein